MLNDISALCPLLKKYGILTVVDSVSGMFGEDVRVDDFQIDVLCGGSQKAVSAPPGLTFVTVSDAAWAAIDGRNVPIASFYANLKVFEGYYEKKWFPYTMPISDIYGLRAAFDNIAGDPDMLARHARIGEACRAAVRGAGLNYTLHPVSPIPSRCLTSRKRRPRMPFYRPCVRSTVSCWQDRLTLRGR